MCFFKERKRKDFLLAKVVMGQEEKKDFLLLSWVPGWSDSVSHKLIAKSDGSVCIPKVVKFYELKLCFCFLL